MDVSKAIDKAAGAEREKVLVPTKPGNTRGERGVSYAGESFSGFTDIGEAVTDAARQWQGYGTALKPAWEPICLARKPLVGTVVANVLAHGTGALNIDACRVEEGDGYAQNAVTQGVSTARTSYDFRQQAGIFKPSQLGRWPANIVHDGSPEVVAGFPDEAGAFAPVRGTEPSDAVNNVLGARERVATAHHGDAGSAARFFYSAKADREDRLGSKHPTVKPVDLMAWLVRLVTPPGGLVLDPFAGSGTTGAAAMREGMRCILIEREAEYVEDINRRIAWVKGQGRLTAQETARKQEGVEALPLFGGKE